MRKSLGLLTGLAVGLMAPMAHAKSLYVGAFGGVNVTHDGSTSAGVATYDLGLLSGIYVGTSVAENFRVEGEISYRVNDLDSLGGSPSAGELQTIAIMGNALFDFGTYSGFKPYIGGGIGFVDVDFTFGGTQFDATELALQFIGGAGMALSPTLALTFEYRAFTTDKLSVGGSLGSVEYLNSGFVVGLRQQF